MLSCSITASLLRGGDAGRPDNTPRIDLAVAYDDRAAHGRSGGRDGTKVGNANRVQRAKYPTRPAPAAAAAAPPAAPVPDMTRAEPVKAAAAADSSAPAAVSLLGSPVLER